jgi:putative ATPase
MAKPSTDLFDLQRQQLVEKEAPLAARMRPRTLDEYIGQEHIIGPGRLLRRAIQADQLSSVIFYGPPGTGKTTLARVIANTTRAHFIAINAVLAGVKDIRDATEVAQQQRGMYGRRTILFVDEVHRFNKAQQDALLPWVENGTVILIGATTENPYFSVNRPLVSRSRIFQLKPLTEDALVAIARQALADAGRGLGGRGLVLPEASRTQLAEAADGDARRALGLLELAADLAEGGEIGPAVVAEVVVGQVRRFDKGGDVFYDQISALHKSVRGSAPDAALYWLARMIDGGCDPLYIARRVVRMASEDVGNADPRALDLALAAWDVLERLGSPEGELALAQAVTFLACAAKSNAVYTAWDAALADARRGSLEVPVHLRNAPTRLMRELGYGRAYRYAHDEPEGYAAGEDYFPQGLQGRRYYRPVPRGLELKIGEKLEHLAELDRRAKGAVPGKVGL